MQKKAPVVLGYSLSATNQVEKKTTPDVSVAAALQQPFTFSFVERFISDFFKFIIIPKNNSVVYFGQRRGVVRNLCNPID